MPKISSKNVAECFDKIDWSYRTADDTTVLTGFRCPVPFYDYNVAMEVKTTEHWVYLRALLQRDIDPARRMTVLGLISRWNERCHLVKFIIVDNCVLVQAEIPVVQFHYQSFYQALEAVCRHSGLAGVEIAILATNPSVCLVYEAEEAARTRSTDYASRSGDDSLAADFDLFVNTMPG